VGRSTGSAGEAAKVRDSADETFAIEFAKYYTMNHKMAKAILLEYERDKRRILIDKIKDGLESLYNKPEEISKLNRLERRLDQLATLK
jgi:hypothetical protein